MLAESGVERVPAPPESSYLGELAQRAQLAILSLLLKGGEMLALPWPLYLALTVALAVLVAVLFARLILSRRRRRGTAEPADVAETGLAPAARTAAVWRAELERRLAEGRIAEALEALWWWLARSLAAGEVEPDWTSRDLVARSRREDLRDLVRRLDAFTYGPRRPAVEDLRRLMGSLEEALA